MALVGAYARQRRVVMLRYKKATTGETVTRYVEPYSVRFKLTKARGRARYFYGWCVSGPTLGIHSFLVSNILAVQGTDQTFSPRYRVEF